MDKIFVGGVSPEGEQLLRSYLNRYMPDAFVEPLSERGIVGKMKNHAVRPDVALVIIDDELIQKCRGLADGVLALPKVHRYVNDDGLKEFLIQKFGSLDSSTETQASGLIIDVDDDDYIPHQDLSKVSDNPISMTESTSFNLPSSIDSERIKELEDKLAQSEMMVRNLTMQLEESSEDADVVSLRTTVAQNELVIRNLTMQLENSSESSDIKDLVSRINELETELAEARDSAVDSSLVESLRAEIDNLKEENAGLEVANQELSTKVYDLQSQVIEIGVLREDAKRSSSEIERLQGVMQELSDCKEEIDSLNVQLIEKAEQLDLAKSSDNELIIELQSQLDEKDLSISDLENTIDNLRQTISELEESVKTLKHKEAETDTLREDIKDKRAKIVTLTADVTRLTSEVEKLTEESETLQISLDEEKELKESLQGKVDEINNTLIELQSDNSVKTEEIESLTSKVIELQQELVTVGTNPERLEELQGIISEKDAIIEGLRSQLASIDSVSNDALVAELNAKIEELTMQLVSVDDLQNELNDLKSKSVSGVSDEELRNLRERCTNLELELAEKDIEVRSNAKGIFGQLANIASPKLAYTVSLPVNVQLDDTFTCIVSGSDESSSALYRTLKHTCITDSNKRILIIDLASDSSIDREFGMSNVVSPIDWLTGMKSFREFVASTSYSNVKVLTTSLAYLNDLYLLQVDWKSRLQELYGSADAIVINLGDINNVVTKVLFNTFSKLMKTYVIAKSTPVNLRSVFLNLSGLRPLSTKVTIECVNFDDKSSKAMYQRLANEYNTQILKNNEILKL